MLSSSRPVSAKGPRKLVPICISKPSAVRRSGTAMTPALFTSRSTRSTPSAKRRTDPRSARSSRRTSTSPVIVAAARAPFSVSRQARMTVAPCAASSRAVTAPIPLFAPVTIAMRPCWSGMSAVVQALMWLRLRHGFLATTHIVHSFTDISLSIVHELRRRAIMGGFPSGGAGFGGAGFGNGGGFGSGAGFGTENMWQMMEQLRSKFEKSAGSRAGRGDVRSAVLALLAEQPMHGYQIIREIDERSGGSWKPSAGSVYPTLQLLSDEGIITAEESGGRKTYALTEAGRDEVAESGATAPWQTGESTEHPGITALPKAGVELAQAAAQVGRTGSPEQVQQAVAVLDEARKRLYAILAQD
jgi:DNA-binding PadR family transcriptional regulator